MNLNDISRAKLQQVLENHGFAVYDSEPTEALREAVRLEIDADEIDESELEK